MNVSSRMIFFSVSSFRSFWFVVFFGKIPLQDASGVDGMTAAVALAFFE